LGSALGAAKSGLVTSIYFAGAVASLNALVLIAFKSQVLAALAEYYTNCSASGPANQPGSAEYCFAALFRGSLLFFFLQLLLISFFFAILYGLFFELLPGGFSYWRKSVLVSLIMLVVVLFTVTPVVGDLDQLILVIAAEVVLAMVLSFFQARLYRRFTREVEFQSADPGVKILVHKRNNAGKKRTYAIGSTQPVEAVGEGKRFKGWLVSGGVSVEDSRSPVTNIHVNGDGLLKATIS